MSGSETRTWPRHESWEFLWYGREMCLDPVDQSYYSMHHKCRERASAGTPGQLADYYYHSLQSAPKRSAKPREGSE